MMTEGIVVAVSTLGLCFGGWCIGRWIGRRERGRRGAMDPAIVAHVGMLQGAMLGLLALLLGFSFAGAANRFMERQRMLVDETNAIGTAWLCADLLPEAQREAMRATLADCVRARANLARTTDPERIDALDVEIDSAQETLWNATVLGLREQPVVAAVVAPAVHDVVDQHGARKAAARQHLPSAVLALLGLASTLALATVGFAEGIAGVRTRVVSVALVALVAAALAVTLDMDHPRRGLIRIDASTMFDLERHLVESHGRG